MATITIYDLQPTEPEFTELSEAELKNIVGGGWFKKIFSSINNAVKSNGGWLKLGVTIGGFFIK